jgi:hypothetical protein
MKIKSYVQFFFVFDVNLSMMTFMLFPSTFCSVVAGINFKYLVQAVDDLDSQLYYLLTKYSVCHSLLC